MKNQKKAVSDEIYNKAYTNEDNINIIKSVKSKYRHFLDDDTLNECGLKGLWRALQFHNAETFTTKFTSSLWKFVNWECHKALKINKRNMKHNNNRVSLSSFTDKSYIDESLNNIENAEIYDKIREHLSEEQYEMLVLRYVLKFTLKEIADKFDYSTETVRQKINICLCVLKDKLVYKELLG